MNLANYHFETGEFLRTVVAMKKRQKANVDELENESKKLTINDYLIPPYHTPAQPDAELADDEYHCFLDSNGNVPRDYKNGAWTVKKRFVKVTAYNKITLEQKEFDDESLVTDDYTLIKPTPTQKWSDEQDDWVDDDEKIISVNQALSKTTLATYIESPIVLVGTDAVYQIDSYARENIDKSIALADSLGLEDDYAQPWKLLDNSWRVTTLGEIKHLKLQYLLRFKTAREALAHWEAGDKLTPFVIDE